MALDKGTDRYYSLDDFTHLPHGYLLWCQSLSNIIKPPEQISAPFSYSETHPLTTSTYLQDQIESDYECFLARRD
jgi:hypothetical protein